MGEEKVWVVMANTDVVGVCETEEVAKRIVQFLEKFGDKSTAYVAVETNWHE